MVLSLTSRVGGCKQQPSRAAAVSRVQAADFGAFFSSDWQLHLKGPGDLLKVLCSQEF